MSAGKIIKFSDILKISSENKDFARGCLVDTSVLFAATFDLDEFNTQAVELFDYLAEIKIPLHANVNIRAEFIDLHRRVMIPEGLASLFTVEGKKLPPALYTQLQSIVTKMNDSKKSGRSYKFSEENIKEWRSRLRQFNNQNEDSWTLFCESFLQGKIEQIWDETCDLLNINFLSLREGESKDWLENDLNWNSMTSLVGKFGLGSFDAMIVNLFLNSHFPAIITADKEIALIINQLKPIDKFVIIPESLNI